MFTDDSLKIHLYGWTAFFLILGGAIGMYWSAWIGFALWILGGVVALHVVIVSTLRERRRDIEAKTFQIEAETQKIVEQRLLYESVKEMDAEARYAFGLSYTPHEVTVKKTKTDEEGNEFSQTWQKLPVPAYKLKTLAQAVLAGEGFTYRKWAGDGKLFTDDEWRVLHDAMVKLGMMEQVGSDPRSGFSWTSFGEDVMTQILKDTL